MEHSQSPTPKTPLVAIMPSPGMGHLIPMIEFAKRLVLHHHLSLVLIIPTSAPPSKAQTTLLRALPPSISHTFLPPVSRSLLPNHAKVETLISLTVLHSLPSLRHALRSFSASHRLLALVVDLFGTDAFDIAAEFDVSPYVFFTSTAMTLSFFLHLPHLHQAVQCEYSELHEPLRIPGCIPVHGKDLLDPVQDRKNEVYKWMLHHAKRYHLAEGIIENSFAELEPGAIKSLQASTKPRVYAVGPLARMENAPSGITEARECECLRWLDDQPRGSVLFVSFGSGGALSTAQMNELALGLEMSKQKFIWVVRSPNDGANVVYFFSGQPQNQTDPYSFLPKGFVERTKGRGLLVESWAPQAQVLSHPSTGGFLTHCGWNSILESVVNGVPLVAWPLYAEQRMNAVMMTEEVRVALRPKASESGIVEREEIARVVKDLMEGEEGKKVRNKMKDLKEAAAKALGDDGSSSKQIAELVQVWKNKATIVVTDYQVADN